MKRKIAEYISQFLVDNGIKDCFMVTGGGAMHLNDALGHQEGLHCVFNHHEQGCAMAAEGYARMTGRIAVVCVTSGPGGTNAITGVMGGWVDSIPMFVISGQVKRETTKWACKELNLRQLGDQEFDIVHSVSNMTKYAVMITEPQDIAYHLEKALYLALHGRKGPVWLDIPLDVQGAVIETDSLRHFHVKDEHMREVPAFSSDMARIVLAKIREAKAPLILAGTGIRLADAQEELLRLAERLQIPVVTAWNANDTIAFDHPLFAGMPGTMGTRPGNFAVQNCDLLLSLGCRLNIRMIGYNHYEFAGNAYKIVADIDAEELAKPTICPDMPIHADVKQLLQALLKEEYVPVQKHTAWTAWCKAKLMKYPAVLEEYKRTDSGLINPYIFIDRLFDHLDAKDRIVCGNGSACVITFQAARIKQGQRMFANSGCASMGYGLPAALGVAVSDNSRRTICIDGDGSIMMNLQELATITYNKLDVKIILLNNNGYHSIRQTQGNLFQPPFVGIDADSGICFPDFSKLAEAFGLSYYRLTEEDCEDVLDQALASKGACICEVMADPAQNFAPKAASRILEDGKLVSSALDDMAPFLDRREYEEEREY